MPTVLDQLARTTAPAPLPDAVRLSGYLDLVPDPRGVRGRRCPLPALVAPATASVLAGARSLTAITERITESRRLKTAAFAHSTTQKPARPSKSSTGEMTSPPASSPSNAST